MKLFINDRLVVIQPLEGPNSITTFETSLTGSDEITSRKLIGNVLITDATSIQIERLLRIIEYKKLKKFKSITFQVKDYPTMVDFVKDQFKIIKASGGIVKKGDKILLIYRLKKWDLPKGKLKRDEDTIRGAKREVEEECNIKVEVKEKLCSTWHSYIRKDKKILKKTNWFIMNCTDDSNMKPQVEEFIDEVKWMKKEDALKAVKNSYLSIQEVLANYYTAIPLNTVR